MVDALRLGMIGRGQIGTRFFDQAERLDGLGWDGVGNRGITTIIDSSA